MFSEMVIPVPHLVHLCLLLNVNTDVKSGIFNLIEV